ncbi:MAG: ATP synthase F1 subunit delta [Candidatus Methylomirabilis sp.]
MVKASVARRYAKALFDLLDTRSIEPTRAGLAGLGQAFTVSPPLKHVMASPAFGLDDKVAVLVGLSQKLKCPPIVTGFLGQLVKKNRVAFLPEIAEAFAALVDEAKGTRQVSVTSATELSPDEQEALRSQLRALLRHEVNVAFHTDPTLLAGLRIQMGSTLYDSTLRARLSAMRQVLRKE